tara:strand:- start:722 stop:895 length:174 start_codon:yes stop_codon:yes gene_type:complete
MAKVKFTRKQWSFIREALRHQEDGFRNEEGGLTEGFEKMSDDIYKIIDKIDLILNNS